MQQLEHCNQVELEQQVWESPELVKVDVSSATLGGAGTVTDGGLAQAS